MGSYRIRPQPCGQGRWESGDGLLQLAQAQRDEDLQRAVDQRTHAQPDCDRHQAAPDQRRIVARGE